MDEEEVEDEEEEDKVRPSREHPQEKLLNIYIFCFAWKLNCKFLLLGVCTIQCIPHPSNLRRDRDRGRQRETDGQSETETEQIGADVDRLR